MTECGREALEQCWFFYSQAVFSGASHLPSVCFTYRPAPRVALSSRQWKDWYIGSHERRGDEQKQERRAEGGRERTVLTSSRGCWLGTLTFTCRQQRGWRWDKRKDRQHSA